MSKGSIVLLSGGLDSAVSALLTAKEFPCRLALTFDYGQRAATREKEASAKIAKRLGVEHKTLTLPWLKELTTTALVETKKDLPQLKASQLDDPTATDESARAVWVPNRNGLFLNIAAVYAEALGFDWIVTGFNAEEAKTFSDNSSPFVETANRFFSFSTRKKVQVCSQTQDLMKSEIVQKGIELGLDFSNLWSCYEGGEKWCGRCESCLRSMRAYKTAGVWEKVKGLYAD
ncbi:MAG: 7-cyano-7-deazaguanine synthase QueC [Deltaproteobacteria bacterium]|nr:7-cyano-7-deazaguanine synthase QueC [Deltaproteobacteria bacterium]